MRKGIKGFFIGAIVTALLTGSVLADGEYQSIEVLANFANFEVNGKEVDADNFVYNGITYVPIRRAAEILDMEVGWDNDTRTVSLNDKKEVIERTNQINKQTKNQLIKKYIDNILKNNLEMEILYGEFLDENEFVFLSKNYKGYKLCLETIVIKDDKVKVINSREFDDIDGPDKEAEMSEEVPRGGGYIGVVQVDPNKPKVFFARPILDVTYYVVAHIANENNEYEKIEYNNHPDFVQESDEIYKFLNPEKYNGSSRSIFIPGEDDYYNSNNVNKTLLDILGIDSAESIKYGYDKH